MTFTNSRILTYVALIMAFVLCVGILLRPSPEAAQVLMLTIPTMLMLAAAWGGISNWAEIKHAGK